MLIYYINLDRRPDRRAFMEQQFAALGLTAIRISATTPDKLSALDVATYCNPSRLTWQTPEELACSMSHLAAMAALTDSKEDMALVLEDDAVLSPSLPSFLTAYGASPPNVGLLRIETTRKRLTLSRDAGPPIAGITLCLNSSWEGGAGAYIISRRAAEFLLAGDRLKFRQCDLAMFDPAEAIARRVAVRQADPALSIQSQFVRQLTIDLPSDLGANASWVAGDAAFPWMRRLRRLIYVLDRDIVVAVRKAWHRLAHGAQRRSVHFKAD